MLLPNTEILLDFGGIGMVLFLNNVLALSLDAAPWLLLGLVLGGLLKTLMPIAWLETHLKGEGFWPVIKAALLGAPLPLCSCGVLPAALGLRRAGASRSATVSFLVSTPETGIDSVSVTYALLGPLMAITRPIAAVISAITAGLLVARSNPDIPPQIASQASAPNSCCSSSEAVSMSCCSSEVQSANGCGGESQDGKWTRLFSGIQYAFTDLLDGILLWLLIGLLFSAAVQTWMPAEFLAVWGSGLLAMILMILVSIPMYVCATASTPIAAGLMMSGISPGTVLVFLLAGPASNIGSLGVIQKELGKHAMIAYLAGVAGVAIASGVLLDWFVIQLGIDIQAQVVASDHLVPSWIAWAALLVLLTVAVSRIRR
jgi:uncharacterized membrane protein YraQ (UPF0718 family)